MKTYSPDFSLRDALRRYFDENGFGADGGYSAAWVDVKLGRVPVALPNSDARRRAVRFHDLHHIVTGYETDTAGEFEIAAWELASGCRGFAAAWVLNLGAFFMGVPTMPGRLLRAFVRGRRSGNFYDDPDGYERLLALTVGEATNRLHTDRPVPKATAPDLFWFGVTAVAGFAITAALLPLFIPLSIVAVPTLHLLRARSARISRDRVVHAGTRPA